MEGFDEADPFSQRRRSKPQGKAISELRVGIPADRCLSEAYEEAYKDSIRKMATLVGSTEEVSFAELFEIAALLYEGPWVAERVAAARTIYEQQPHALLPVIKQIFDGAARFSAVDTFEAQYRLRTLARRAEHVWNDVDVLCVPTAPRHPLLAEVAADPIGVNAELGRYTNFVNLLGWSAIAVPADLLPDGMPFGITLIAPGWAEPNLVKWATEWVDHLKLDRGAFKGKFQSERSDDWSWPDGGCPDACVRIAVVGAHLRGMPLNHELLACDARFVEETRTAANYRLYALAGSVPPKPGLALDNEGRPIVVEVWNMPVAKLGQFVAGVPAPLGIGNVTLENGEVVKGFICEGHAIAQGLDITDHGGWRSYRSSVRV